MTETLKYGNLTVAKELDDFLRSEVIEGIEVDADQFWASLETILDDFGPRNKELLEAGTFKIISFGTGKFGRVLGEIFVNEDAVGGPVPEGVDRSSDGLVSINDILIAEGHAYDYHGGKKKDFEAEIEKEKAAKKEDMVDKPAEEQEATKEEE